MFQRCVEEMHVQTDDLPDGAPSAPRQPPLVSIATDPIETIESSQEYSEDSPFTESQEERIAVLKELDSSFDHDIHPPYREEQSKCPSTAKK